MSRLDLPSMSTTELIEHLHDLTDQSITWLCDSSQQQVQAQAIGRQLARLSNLHPETLGVTLRVWSDQLSEELSEEAAVTLQGRLAALFGEMATGFIIETHELLQAEQHQARSALVMAHTQIGHALRETKSQLRLVMRHVPAVLAMFDRKGTVALLEGKGLRALRLKPSEIVGRSIFEMAGDMPDILEHISRALAGESSTAVIKIRHLAFEAQYEPLRNESGIVNGAICVAFANTTMRRAGGRLSSPASAPPAPPAPSTRQPRVSLNPGEMEVVQMLIHGCTNQQIAAQLSLSKQGVAKRLEKLYTKLSVSNRTEAVALIVQLGLIDIPVAWGALPLAE